MRILVASLGAYGHLFPMMPLAVACRDAGHNVLVATGPPFLDSLELPTVPTYPSELNLSWAEQETRRRHPELHGVEFSIAMFADVTAGAALPTTLQASSAYQPDLIVYEPSHVAAGIAADLLELPAAVFTVGLGTFFVDVVHSRVRDFHRSAWLERGRPVPSGSMLGQVLIDPTPPALRGSGELRRQPIRSRAYAPPDATVPDWLREPATRPRVYVTLGTVSFGAVEILGRAVREAASHDAEVLVAIGPGGDPAALGELPDNVHLERFVAQSEVLANVDLIIHHGGSGTVLGALEAGIPQVIMPQGADQFYNAELIGRVGAGRALHNEAYVPGAIAELTATLVGECPERDVAATIQAEILAMPDPSAVVEELPRIGRS